MKNKEYSDLLIDEIIEMLKTNLLLMYQCNDDYLINIRNYCKEKDTIKYKPISYEELVFFTEEALADLIKTPFLYDFRPLE